MSDERQPRDRATLDSAHAPVRTDTIPADAATGERPREGCPPGERLGRFSLRREFGHGGMGTVYEAVDSSSGATVALKTLGRGQSEAARLKHEFRVAASLSHPNIVVLYELFADQAVTYFTMELLRGPTLLEFVRGAGAERARRLLDVLPGILDALEFLHAHELVHGDIKPGNILIDHERGPVVLDFGLSEALQAAGFTDPTRIAGTPGYMAPELFAGQRRTPASDWYALGVLLRWAHNARAETGGEPTRVGSVRGRRRERERHGSSRLDHALQALCAGLMHTDPARRFAALEVRDALRPWWGARRDVSSAPALPTTRSAPGLVGRSEELAVLSRALEASRTGLQIVVVQGASGIGKTALLRHFAAGTIAAGGRAWLNRCHECERVPYKLLEGLLDEMASALLAQPESARAARLSAADLAALVTAFSAFSACYPSLHCTTSRDDRELRRQASLALRALLRQFASLAPVVIAFDDLQWGDLDSIGVLEHLLAPAEAPPLLVICCVRSESLGKSACANALFELPALRGQRAIVLGPLPSHEARELAGRTLSALGSSALHLAERVDEAQGHPLFVIELARFLDAEANSGALARGTADERLDALLRARIERLRPPSRALLEVIALSRGPITQQIAYAAIDSDHSPVLALHALRSDLLIRSDGPEPTDTIEVLHDRIRGVVLANLAPERARQLHPRLAAALERHAPTDHEALHWHYRHAGEPERASAQALLAAQDAASSLAFERAARLYEAAFELEPALRERAPLLRALADSLRHAGHAARAAAAYRAAAKLVSRDEALDLRRWAALQLLSSGHLSEGEAEIARLLPEVGLSYPRSTLRALAGLAWRRALLAAAPTRMPLRAEADVPPALLRRVDMAWAASQGIFMVDVVRGARLAADSHLAALRAREPHRLAAALATAAISQAYRGPQHRASVRKLLHAAQRVARHSPNLHTPIWLRLMEAAAEVTQGNLVSGLGKCVELEAALAQYPGEAFWERSTNRNLLLTALFRMGRFGEIGPRVEPAFREAGARGNVYEAVMLRLWAVTACLANDDVAGASANTGEILHEWPGQGFQLQHYHHFVANLMLRIYRAHYREAWRFAEDIWPRWRLSMTRTICMEAALSWNLRGTAALGFFEQTGDRSARRVADKCARWLSRSPYPTAAAMAAMIEGQLARRERAGEASSLLARAERDFSSHDRLAAAASAAYARAQTERSHELQQLATQRLRQLGARDPDAMRRLWIG